MCRDFIRGSACERKRGKAGNSEKAVRPPGNSDSSVERGRERASQTTMQSKEGSARLLAGP